MPGFRIHFQIDTVSMEAPMLSIHSMALLYSLATGVETPEDISDWRRCIGDGADAVLSSCTRLIDEKRLPDPTERAIAYYHRGNAYFLRSDYDRAFLDYNNSIALDPTEEAYFIGRGNIFDLRGDFSQALADYDKAISSIPKARKHTIIVA